MSKFSRAGTFLLTGIFLLILVLPSQAVEVVNNNSDGDGSLAWAVQQVNAGNGNTIIVSASVKTLHLSRELTFTRSVTITGNGALIEGENTRRLFRVTDGRTVFDGLTFTAGNAVAGNGGAVEVDGSGASAEFVNCIFYSNKARDYGGAVSVTRGNELNPTIFRNCTITANNADSGGGISVSSGTAHVFSSIVTGNSGNDDIHSAGGAIYTRYDLIGTMNVSADMTDKTGQSVIDVLVSENGVAKVDIVSDIHMIRITRDSPAYNITTDPEYSASYDIAGTSRPQFGGYDAGAYEIPGVALQGVRLNGQPYMQVNTSAAYTYEITPADASMVSVYWRSSNPEIVSADDAGVRALGIGSADLWLEVHGWDSQGRELVIPSENVRVRVGEEAFTELQALISDVADRTLDLGETVTVTPTVNLLVDRYNLDGVDGVGYTLTADSSSPDIVSVEAVSGNRVTLKAGYIEGIADITLHTTPTPYTGKPDSYTFTVAVEDMSDTGITSNDKPSTGGIQGTGKAGGGCNTGVMILAGMIAAMFIRKGKNHAE